MASFNKVILMGNLTRDPEMRVTPGGLAICKFSVACSRKFKDKEGNDREEVAFIDVECFNKQAEVVAKYFSKGKPILVEGRLKQDTWDDKDTGKKRSKIVVNLESFSFVGGRDSGGEGGAPGGEAASGANYDDNAPPARPAAPPRSAAPRPPAAQRPPPPGDQIDEDVPF